MNPSPSPSPSPFLILFVAVTMTVADLHVRSSRIIQLCERTSLASTLPTSPAITRMHRFMDAMGTVPFRKGGYYVARLDMDAADWIKIRRPRPVLVCLVKQVRVPLEPFKCTQFHVLVLHCSDCSAVMLSYA